jgi:hypothetical protein
MKKWLFFSKNGNIIQILSENTFIFKIWLWQRKNVPISGASLSTIGLILLEINLLPLSDDNIIFPLFRRTDLQDIRYPWNPIVQPHSNQNQREVR